MGNDASEPETSQHYPPKEIEAIYTYEDSTGKEVFKTVRYKNPKSFRLCHDESDGTTAWNIKGIPLIPYRLPQLLDAVRHKRPIFVVEGEKDVDNMTRIGLDATCNPMGAGKWKNDYAKYFVGAKIVTIISDNDSEQNNWTGQKHALAIQKSLSAAGVCSNIIYSPSGKDISDFINSGVLLDEARSKILTLATNPPPWKDPWDLRNAFPRFGKALTQDTNTNEVTYEGNIWISDTENYTIKLETPILGLEATLRKTRIEFVSKYYEKHMSDKNSYPPKKSFEDLENLTIVMWLRQNGSFFWNTKTKNLNDLFYFRKSDGRILRISSDEFSVWISNSAHLNRGDKRFFRTLTFIQDAAMDPAVSTGVVPSAFIARHGNTVYISCGEAQMIKCAPGNVTCIANGSDGIFFPREHTLAPFKLLPEDAHVNDPFHNLAQFSSMAYANWHSPVLLEEWYLNIFACHENHTPLLLTGERNSGKTHLSSGLRLMAGFPQRDASIDPKKEEDFWVSANEPGLLRFDNLEEEVMGAKWFSSAMEKITTGNGKEARKYYAQEAMQYNPRAHIILTSKIPHYAANDGLSNRLAIISLNADISEYEDKSLFLEIECHRDEAMTWTARTIAAALACDIHTDRNLNERYPDFGDFAQKCGHVLGREEEFVNALKCGEFEKSRIVLQQDEHARLILDFLSNKSIAWEGTMMEIVESESHLINENEKKCLSMRLGKTVTRLKKAFDTCFPGHTSRQSNGRTLYRFPQMSKGINNQSIPNL